MDIGDISTGCTTTLPHYRNNPLPETLGCCVLGILCIRDVATSPIHNIPNSDQIQWARGNLRRRTPATHRLNDACAWQGWAGTRQHKSGCGRANRGERHQEDEIRGVKAQGIKKGATARMQRSASVPLHHAHLNLHLLRSVRHSFAKFWHRSFWCVLAPTFGANLQFFGVECAAPFSS